MFQIQFDDNPDGVYLAGQTIKGKLMLHLLKEKAIQGLSIHITGKASVQWSESDTSDSSKSNTYYGSEKYLDTKTYVLGDKNGQAMTLPPGKYSYDFQCLLPVQLPSSFESANGNIRYIVTAILERSWKFNQTSKVAFTVLQKVDLNRMEVALAIPVKMDFNKYFCCGPCRFGPLQVSTQVPQTGFVPDEKINVTTDINNYTKNAVTGIHSALLKKVTCYSDIGRSVKETKCLLKEVTLNLEKNKQARFVVELIVPAIVPSFSTTVCKIIEVAYEVMVEVKVSGMNVNPKLRIPIVIGSEPLRTELSQPETNNILDSIPPPSYEQCMTDDTVRRAKGSEDNGPP